MPLPARRPDGDRAHHRSSAAEDAQRQDDRTRQTDLIARQAVERQILNLVDAVLSEVVVMHAERQARQGVGRQRRRHGIRERIVESDEHHRARRQVLLRIDGQAGPCE